MKAKVMNFSAKNMLVTFLAFSLLCLLTLKAYAQEGPLSLFVISAPTAEIVATSKPEGLDQYQIKLMNVQPNLTYFTEKPNRVTGTATANEFIRAWNDNKLDTTINQPNVSVVGYVNNATKPTVYVFQLDHPNMNMQNNTMTFNAKALGDKKPPRDKVETLHKVSMFVDDFHWNGNKFKH